MCQTDALWSSNWWRDSPYGLCDVMCRYIGFVQTIRHWIKDGISGKERRSQAVGILPVGKPVRSSSVPAAELLHIPPLSICRCHEAYRQWEQQQWQLS